MSISTFREPRAQPNDLMAHPLHPLQDPVEHFFPFHLLQPIPLPLLFQASHLIRQ